MTESAPTSEDLLTEKEFREYREAMRDHASLLREATGAAMDLADLVFAVHKLRSDAYNAGKKQQKVLERIVKSRGRPTDDVKTIDMERGVIVWK